MDQLERIRLQSGGIRYFEDVRTRVGHPDNEFSTREIDKGEGREGIGE